MTNRAATCLIATAVLLLGNIALAQTPTTKPTRIKLWDKTPDIAQGPDSDVNPLEPTMDIYLPPKETASGAAIVILPGGGYTNLSTVKEGSAVAEFLLKHNIAGFVVRYRHAPRYHNPIPMEDAARALRTARANAADYGVDPKRIGIIGFSAGGHLAATMATQFDAGKADSADAFDRVSDRPDFAILLYPVITFTDEAAVHKGSRTALVGNDQKLWTAMSAELNVTSNTPPTFLIHATTDNTVPVENSILFYQACVKNKVPVEMHLFEKGPHGFGLGGNDPVLTRWPGMMIDWMVSNKWIPGS